MAPVQCVEDVTTHYRGQTAPAVSPTAGLEGGAARGSVRLREPMATMLGSTRVMTRADAAAISQFRQAQYRRSRDLTIADESILLWDEHDDLSIVLAVRAQDGSILATMRVEPLRDAHDAALALDCPVPLAAPVFPAMLLGRAATRADCEKLGLNSLMRLHFLRFARERGVRHIYGRVYGEAARTHLMRAIGYSFFPHPKGAGLSGGTTGAHSALQIAVLDLQTHGEHALRALESRVGDLLIRFPVRDQLRDDSFTGAQAALELLRRRLPREAFQLRGTGHPAMRAL